MKNLFETTGNDKIAGDCFITKKPSEDLLNRIIKFNEKQDKDERNIKLFSALFIEVMLVFWIGGDIFGMPSNLKITFGIITLFGYPILRVIGSAWLCRPSAKKLSEELEFSSLFQMNTPENAYTLEVFTPVKKDSAGWVHGNKGGYICENELFIAYADNEFLYLADVTRTMRIPLTSFNSIENKSQKCRIKKWIQPTSISKFKKYGVRMNSGLEFFLPLWISMHFPSKIIVPYLSVEFRTAEGEFTIMIPSYDADKICELTKLKIYE